MVYLLFVEHVVSAVVENLHSEEAFLELAFGINRVLHGLFGYDLHVFVKDAI